MGPHGMINTGCILPLFPALLSCYHLQKNPVTIITYQKDETTRWNICKEKKRQMGVHLSQMLSKS